MLRFFNKFVSSIREPALALAATCYGFGLVVWCIYASRQGVVITKVVDLQYFAGGILPVASLILTVSVHKFQHILADPIRIAISVVFVAFAMVIPAALHAINPSSEGVLSFFSSSYLGLVYTCLFVIIGAPSSAVLIALLDNLLGIEKQNGALIVKYVFIGFVFALTFLLYIFYVYPRIPQALGGAKPRCAIVTLSMKDAREIFLIYDKPDIREITKDVAYVGVEVIYGSETTLFLRPTTVDNHRTNYNYEIARERFSSIAWCRWVW